MQDGTADLRTEVRQCVADFYEVPFRKVKESWSFAKHLQSGNYQFEEFIFACEDRFDINLDWDHLDKIELVSELIDLVEFLTGRTTDKPAVLTKNARKGPPLRVQNFCKDKVIPKTTNALVVLAWAALIASICGVSAMTILPLYGAIIVGAVMLGVVYCVIEIPWRQIMDNNKSKNVSVNVSGGGHAIVAVGDVVKHVSTNINDLRQGNTIDLAEVLDRFLQSVQSTPGLTDIQKRDVAEQIDGLTEEAKKPTEVRRLGTVKAILSGVGTALTGIHDCHEIWESAIPIINRVFGL